MARTTVADVLVDGLARAGTRHVFCGPATAPGPALSGALEGRGLPRIVAGPPTLMAAVTGMLTGAPGAAILAPDALVASAGDLAHAGIDREPLVVITEGGPHRGAHGIIRPWRS
jgi:hypothetical protein